jgi:8-oxo-dGTP pyrophosphatase MutT (NUDIX family)
LDIERTLVPHDQPLNLIPVVRFSSIVVLDESLRILLVCEAKPGLEGLWNTPGGGDEPGEMPIHAAKRELYEETGLTNVEPRFLETFLWHGDRGDILMCHVFLVRVDSSVDISPVHTDEILEVRWFDKFEFDNMYEDHMIRTDFTKLFVESALNHVRTSPVDPGEPT